VECTVGTHHTPNLGERKIPYADEDRGWLNIVQEEEGIFLRRDPTSHPRRGKEVEKEESFLVLSICLYANVVPKEPFSTRGLFTSGGCNHHRNGGKKEEQYEVPPHEKSFLLTLGKENLNSHLRFVMIFQRGGEGGAQWGVAFL